MGIFIRLFSLIGRYKRDCDRDGAWVIPLILNMSENYMDICFIIVLYIEHILIYFGIMIYITINKIRLKKCPLLNQWVFAVQFLSIQYFVNTRHSLNSPQVSKNAKKMRIV